jgi:hypothetical protein
MQLEAFLGLFAACFSTIRFLSKGLSLESVVDRIRNAFLLISINSNRYRLADQRARGSESQRDLATSVEEISLAERSIDRGTHSDTNARQSQVSPFEMFW